MKKLSQKEWIAVAAAIVFVGYTLFGSQITDLFQKNTMTEDDVAGAALSSALAGGLIVNDIVVGDGAAAKSGDLVSAHYILSLTDGTTIQNSKSFGAPHQFTLGRGEVIQGWDQGLVGMKVGGVRTLIVPADLAYGPNQNGPIPANSTLIFTVELVAIDTPMSDTPELVQ